MGVSWKEWRGWDEAALGDALASLVGRDRFGNRLPAQDRPVKANAPAIAVEVAAYGAQRTVVLILAASPHNMQHLRLDREQAEIQKELDRARFGETFEVQIRPALMYGDLQFVLLNATPRILHFSGHGDVPGIFVEDQAGKSRLIPGEALADLLGQTVIRHELRLVVLSACLSAEQAKSIAATIDGAVVGMAANISDGAAISFAAGLYGGLGRQLSVLDSFNLARNRLALIGDLPETATPQIFAGPNVDLGQLTLV